MTGEADEEVGGWGFLVTLRHRDQGVYLFLVFIGALVIGFALTLLGRNGLGAVLMLCAIVSLMVALLRPSRTALTKREAAQYEEEAPEERADEDEEAAGPPVDGRPAVTSARRGVPAPPPEPPPMEDVVVDLDAGEVAPAEGDDDVWVE